MSPIGSAERPLRVAVIGAGPSGFYAVGALVKDADVNVTVDIFERLIAPHGLVRYGVAPDHQNIKAVSKIYERTAADARVRYFGNVEFGKDITLADLQRHYDQIIFATGAQSDRRLGIPGEYLPNSFSATEFVAWYNGHPDFAHLDPDLSVTGAVVVGVGNVAMDVARILAKTVDELKDTDIADYALDDLATSHIKDIYILSRRGPAQVKFTNAEIREFGHLEAADALVQQEELVIDRVSSKQIEGDTSAQKNIDYMRAYAEIGDTGKARKVHFRFLISPVEIIGDESGRITGVKCERNQLVPTDDGDVKAVGTGEFVTIPAGLVLRSVGYKGMPLADVPYNDRSGTIPNSDGRIVGAEGSVIPGLYVVGWAKRGPTGVIGTNKPDSVETVNAMLQDVPTLPGAQDPNPDAIVELLQSRGVRYVTAEEWDRISQTEIARGAAQNRPRVKLIEKHDMLKMLSPHEAEAEKVALSPSSIHGGEMDAVE